MMNDDLKTYIEPEMEARIVALVLGEASAFEAGELERLIAKKIELQVYRKRLENIHGLLGDAHQAHDDLEWKLSEKRRGKVFARIEEGKREYEALIERQREKRQSRQRLVYACAACLVVSMILLVTMQLSKKSASYEMAESAPQISPEEALAQLEAPAQLIEMLPAESSSRKSDALGSRGKTADFASALASLDEAMPAGEIADESLGINGIGTGGAVTGFTRLVPTDSKPQENGRISGEDNFRFGGSKKDLTTADLPQVGRLFRDHERKGESVTDGGDVVSGIASAVRGLNDDFLAEGEPGASATEGPVVLKKMAENDIVRKPSAPSSAASKAIAATTVAPSAIPVPVLETPAPSANFGDGEDFGEGWKQNPEDGKDRVASREKRRPDSSDLGKAKSSDGEAPWDFELTDRLETEKQGEVSESLSLRVGKESLDSSSIFDLAPAPAGGEAIPFNHSAGVNLDFDDSLEVDRFFQSGNEGGRDSRNHRDSIESVEAKDLPKIPVWGKESDEAKPEKKEKGSYAFWAEGENSKQNIGRPDSDLDGLSDKQEMVEFDLDAPAGSGELEAPDIRTESMSDRIGVGNVAGSLIEQEQIRRDLNVDLSDKSLMEGREAYANGDYESAVQKYREALNELPYGTATAERREFLSKSLADGAVALTQNYRRVGKYQEARDLLEEVSKNDPGIVEVTKGLEYLEDPIRGVPSLTYEHTKNVDQVRRKLYKGESFYDIGLYDKADEEFKEILRIDPHNKAARRWMERTSAIKSDYYRAAYDQTRAEMLMEVDSAWELAVPPVYESERTERDSSSFLFGEDQVAGDLLADVDPMSMGNAGELSIIAKGTQIILPEVKFQNATVAEALEVVRLRARELDNTTINDSQKGVNIVLGDSDVLQRTLPEIDLKNVPLQILLERIGEATGMNLTQDDYAYRFSKGEDTEVFAEPNGDQVNKVAVVKLNQVILPEIHLNQATMGEALEFIKLRSIELDNTTPDESQKGLEIVIDDPELNKKLLDGRVIAELKLQNVPLMTAIEEIARQAGCKVRVAQGKVIVSPDPARKVTVSPDGFETSTAEKSDSTFSLNVSDVSFKLAKSALAEGHWPDASKVRPEEFVNALDYDDTKPTQAEKISCEIEQGSHPFMQQRNLMRIAMSTASLGRNASTPLRLTILLDQSGSMERADRAESVKRAFALLAAQLNPIDEVTLVGFARTPRLLAERVKGNEMAKLAAIVANPITEGGTNLEEALSSGLQLARQQFVAGAQNRIILLTDGAANLGDALPENLARQVESMREAGIAFDACGVGADGLNDEVLSSLAKQGDGRYYFLDRPEDADEGFARQIAGALRPAAKNVKVQILFNPERVATFKLYGFEKHKLKKEDFRNDSVDAAEMAAEESGVALYHFEPLPEGRGDIGTVSVRFLDTASNEMVERTWAIPYLPEAPLFSEAKPSLRLASVAALFAEKLKASPVGDRVDLKRLRQETQELKASFSTQVRFRELEVMLQQAGN